MLWPSATNSILPRWALEHLQGLTSLFWARGHKRYFISFYDWDVFLPGQSTWGSMWQLQKLGERERAEFHGPQLDKSRSTRPTHVTNQRFVRWKRPIARLAAVTRQLSKALTRAAEREPYYEKAELFYWCAKIKYIQRWFKGKLWDCLTIKWIIWCILLFNHR